MGYSFGEEDLAKNENGHLQINKKQQLKSLLTGFEILFMSYFFKHMRHLSEVLMI